MLYTFFTQAFGRIGVTTGGRSFDLAQDDGMPTSNFQLPTSIFRHEVSPESLEYAGEQ